MHLAHQIDHRDARQLRSAVCRRCREALSSVREVCWSKVRGAICRRCRDVVSGAREACWSKVGRVVRNGGCLVQRSSIQDLHTWHGRKSRSGQGGRSNIDSGSNTTVAVAERWSGESGGRGGKQASCDEFGVLRHDGFQTLEWAGLKVWCSSQCSK